MNSGEIVRCCWRHKVYRDLFYVVEMAPSAEVVAGRQVEVAVICPHALPGLELDLAEAAHLEKDRMDYELFEPVCHDSTHLLRDIGAAHLECRQAEEEWKAADTRGKALKKVHDLKLEKLQQVVRDATNPKPLPLFEKAASS